MSKKHEYVNRWMNGVKPRSRDSMPAKGWLRFADRGQHGWYRSGEDRKEIIVYKVYTGSEGDSLAYAWGWDLARKNLPRSFVEQIAGDYAGTLFATVLLKGFDDFYRPAKIERIRLDYEMEAR